MVPDQSRKDGTVLARSGVPITATTSTQIVDAILGGTLWWHRSPERCGRAHWSGDQCHQKDHGPRSRHPRPEGLPPRQDRGTLRPGLGPRTRQARSSNSAKSSKTPAKTPQTRALREARHRRRHRPPRSHPEPEPASARRIHRSRDQDRDGTVIVSFEINNSWTDQAYSTKFSDPTTRDRPRSSPRLFSFNSPRRMPHLPRPGRLLEFDETLVVPTNNSPSPPARSGME